MMMTIYCKTTITRTTEKDEDNKTKQNEILQRKMMLRRGGGISDQKTTKSSWFRRRVYRIISFFRTDQVLLNGAFEHLHDPILSIPPSIRPHDANGISDTFERSTFPASHTRNGYQSAFARKFALLRDWAPIHVALLVRRSPHRT